MNKKIKKVAGILNNHGVVIIPTDTVYGIATLLGNKKGIKRIYKIKKRKLHKPLAILIPSINWVWKWVEKTKNLVELCENYWPGATTLIMKTIDKKVIGLRMPDYKPVIEIMSITGPLCATSANISGKRAPVSTEDIPEKIKQACDLIIDFPLLRPSGKPSKVIDTRNKSLKVIRG